MGDSKDRTEDDFLERPAILVATATGASPQSGDDNRFPGASGNPVTQRPKNKG